jgi:hypothetical protein
MICNASTNFLTPKKVLTKVKNDNVGLVDKTVTNVAKALVYLYLHRHLIYIFFSILPD